MPEMLKGGMVSITLCAKARYKNGITTCLKKGATYSKPSEVWAIVPRKNLGKGKTKTVVKTVVIKEKAEVKFLEPKRLDWRFTGLVGHGYRGLKSKGENNGVSVEPRDDVVFGASVGYKVTDTEEISATILNNNTQLIGISKFFE